MSEFIEHAKEQFQYDLSVKRSRNPDTFESLFQSDANEGGAEIIADEKDDLCASVCSIFRITTIIYTRINEETKMKRLLLNEREFLKKKEIKFGHVYIFKDGRLGLYLGTSLDNQFVFYILAKAHLVQTDDYGILTFAHYENQVKFLIELSDELLQSKCDKKCVIRLTSLPDLYCDFNYISYDKGNKLQLWHERNKDESKTLQRLIEFTENKKPIVSFVSAKDLIPGELYYTGSLWRSLYMYLGRDGKNNFCWYFVGNEDTLIKNDILEYQRNIERTKANKRCKKLTDAVNDSNAYIYADAKKLIDLQWKGNLKGLILR